jgi:hypothetical protein
VPIDKTLLDLENLVHGELLEIKRIIYILISIYFDLGKHVLKWHRMLITLCITNTTYGMQATTGLREKKLGTGGF